jgi:hypothetical protein
MVTASAPEAGAQVPSKESRRQELKAYLMGNQETAQCCFCEKHFGKDRITFEHIRPKSQGGGFSPENLLLSCAPCNRKRGAMTFQRFWRQRRAELGLPRAPVPEKVRKAYRRSRIRRRRRTGASERSMSSRAETLRDHYDSANG